MQFENPYFQSLCFCIPLFPIGIRYKEVADWWNKSQTSCSSKVLWCYSTEVNVISWYLLDSSLYRMWRILIQTTVKFWLPKFMLSENAPFNHAYYQQQYSIKILRLYANQRLENYYCFNEFVTESRNII